MRAVPHQLQLRQLHLYRQQLLWWLRQAAHRAELAALASAVRPVLMCSLARVDWSGSDDLLPGSRLVFSLPI